MKRVLTIQDISCIGKCSLTVALPILSAAGLETAILPTAVLSTHTAFSTPVIHDLDEQLLPIAEHWKKNGFTFDCIYTGYLASEAQVEKIKKIVKEFDRAEAEADSSVNTAGKKNSPLLIIDPVMGDNGKLYSAFHEAYVERMKSYCGMADIMLPNLTEAAFMTGLPYRDEYDEAYVQELLMKLAELGAKKIILTGIGLQPDKTGAYGYDSETKEFYAYENDLLPKKCHGTGDIFASAFTGAIVNGIDWREAMGIAADFAAKSIEYTMLDSNPNWYGVNFEQAIPQYIERLDRK